MKEKTALLFRLFAALAVCVLLAAALFACSPEILDYPPLIDAEREYTEVSITDEQKHVADFCRIENYFVSGNHKIIRVISKQGYVNDIELLALLEGTTIRQIKGLNVKESKNYGAKCFNDNFLSQFYGIDLAAAAPLSGRQDNYEDGDILYVTRATKTSRAIITAINAAALFLREME